MKLVIIGVVVLFLGFYMFSDPSGLADLASAGASNGWSLISQVFEATIAFIDELF